MLGWGRTRITEIDFLKYYYEEESKRAYWEDRYHATVIETDKHLLHCLVYIDLNMVRAGVVDHPSEWRFCGCNEILAPRQRYALIDYDGLRGLLNFDSMNDLAAAYRRWIEEALGGR